MKRIFPDVVPVVGRVRMCLELVREQNITGKTIVDVGSSFGWLENGLKESGAKLVGIDSNKDAVEFARKKLGRKATFYIGNAIKIPLKDSCADIVTFFDVIEHLPKKTEKKALNEIKRVLKKEGLLLLTTPNSHWLSNLLDPAWYFGHRHYKEREIVKLLEDCGYKILSVEKGGNIWNSLYLIWLYFTVHLFGPNTKIWSWIEKKEDEGYKKHGYVTLVVVARKS